jgi:hypothetical protein
MKMLLPDSNVRGIPFKTRKNQERLLAPAATRPETYVHPYEFGYVIAGGGMGDFIVYLRAFEWLADTLPHLYGRLFYPDFLVQFAQYIFSDRPNWKIESNKLCNRDDWNPGFNFIDPNLGRRIQFLTAHGAHPLELGFALYANELRIPADYNNYPQIILDSENLPDGLIPGKYAVFTPGAIVETRTVPGHFWNPIIDHVKSLGLIPVVLGRREVDRGYLAKIASGFNMEGVINLWDQTTVVEAARILQWSAVTIGLDNGLLHLAGCTTAPIVFGYNVVVPEYRRPRRLIGKTIDVFLSPEDLACAGCLNRVKGAYNRNFDECLYKSIDKLPHPKCIDMLFADNGQRWINAINLALN